MGIVKHSDCSMVISWDFMGISWDFMEDDWGYTGNISNMEKYHGIWNIPSGKRTKSCRESPVFSG